MEYIDYFESPIGIIEIIASDKEIKRLYTVNKTNQDKNPNNLTDNCIKQLIEYFKGRKKEFHIPLDKAGTEFQKKVWETISKIPYGITVSYLDIAKPLGDKNLSRAVGTAIGKNPVLIITPCHRIINKNGKIGSFAAGIDKKQWLLAHEANYYGY